MLMAMKTQFDIVMSMKTPRGFANYGQFYAGSEREAAYSLFAQLKGSDLPDDHAVLHVDLVETENGVPVAIKSKSCTLDELGWNCKQVAREVFRLRTIKEAADG